VQLRAPSSGPQQALAMRSAPSFRAVCSYANRHLPRQARDKRKESSWKCGRVAFGQVILPRYPKDLRGDMPDPWDNSYPYGNSCGTRHFCATFILQTIILARQARDKHGESGAKQVFLQVAEGALAHGDDQPKQLGSLQRIAAACLPRPPGQLLPGV